MTPKETPPIDQQREHQISTDFLKRTLAKVISRIRTAFRLCTAEKNPRDQSKPPSQNLARQG